jgi:hypothetical protein
MTVNATIAVERAITARDPKLEWRLASRIENGTPRRKGDVEKKPVSRMAKP